MFLTIQRENVITLMISHFSGERNAIFEGEPIYVVRTIESTLGAGKVVDPIEKCSVNIECLFWCKMTWGSMFTKVILLKLVEFHKCF